MKRVRGKEGREWKRESGGRTEKTPGGRRGGGTGGCGWCGGRGGTREGRRGCQGRRRGRGTGGGWWRQKKESGRTERKSKKVIEAEELGAAGGVEAEEGVGEDVGGGGEAEGLGKEELGGEAMESGGVGVENRIVRGGVLSKGGGIPVEGICKGVGQEEEELATGIGEWLKEEGGGGRRKKKKRMRKRERGGISEEGESDMQTRILM